MKKIIFSIIIFIILVSYFLVIYMPKDYITNYMVTDFNIIEKYDSKKRIIHFNIVKDENKYNLSLKMNYTQRRHLIKDVEYIFEDNISCVLPIIENKKTYPLCKEDDKNIHFSLVNNDNIQNFIDKHYKFTNNDAGKEYENIEIFDFNKNVFIVWNYDSLLYLSDKENKKISLFKSEVLDTSLIYKINKYLIMPNYDEKYNFTSFYIIDLDKFEKTLWETEYEISYNSYILGSHDDNLFLVDRKNKLQYKITPNKQKISIVNLKDKSAIIYNEGFEKISINKLVNKDHKFINQSAFNFKYENNNFVVKDFENNETLLLNKPNIKIIASEEHQVFYLINDELYTFDLYKGPIKLMKYFEWNFNYQNKIFIYK